VLLLGAEKAIWLSPVSFWLGVSLFLTLLVV